MITYCQYKINNGGITMTEKETKEECCEEKEDKEEKEKPAEAIPASA